MERELEAKWIDAGRLVSAPARLGAPNRWLGFGFFGHPKMDATGSVLKWMRARGVKPTQNHGGSSFSKPLKASTKPLRMLGNEWDSFF